MMRKLIILIMGMILLVVSVSGFDYVIWNPSDDTGDCSNKICPSQTKPLQGESYIDQTFNTDITRITDYVADGHDTLIQYTTFSCSNSDNTKVGFNPHSYDISVYSTINNLYLGTIDITPGPIGPYPGGTQEFRWSQDLATPNLGYFRSGKVFYSVDINSGFPGVVNVEHDFTDDYPDSNVIQNNDKGEQSWGNIGGYYDRYWAFIAGDSGDWMSNVKDLIIYDRGTDTVYKKDLMTLCSEQGWICNGGVRWATMTPGGTYIAKINDATAGSSNTRLIALERLGTDSLSLVWSNCIADGGLYDFSHPTWGYTAEGEEFIFFCNTMPTIAYWRVSDGTRVDLFQVGGASSECSTCLAGCGHEGCANHWSSSYNRDLDGWIFGTSYGVINTPSEFLTEEVQAIRLSTDPDKQKIWRVAWTYDDSSGDGFYNSQARAQINQDGKNIYFASNFLSHIAGTQDIYRISLPDNWWEDLSGEPPQIIFETNFDDVDDFTIPEGSSAISNVFPTYTQGIDNFPSDYPASGTGPRYVGWYESPTYMSVNEHNSLYIDSNNSRGPGKGVTHYHEVTLGDQPFEASNGALYISLADDVGDRNNSGYNEVWVSMWKKYDPNFYEDDEEIKYMHISAYDSSQSLTDWFPGGDPDAHAPAVIMGQQGLGLTDTTGNNKLHNYYMFIMYPYDNRTDFQGNTAGDLLEGIWRGRTAYTYRTDVVLSGGTVNGGWKNSPNYGDGDYHFHEWVVKINSAPGVADGEFAHYIDGQAQMKFTNIPWVKDGQQMVKWNNVVLGGNEDFDDDTAEWETWSAYDDVVISNYRVGSTYIIGNQTYHKADLDHSGDINKTEINGYVEKWKGDMTISLSDIIEAIGIWKNDGGY
ncbi:MAG: hypothetical protein ABIB79_03315 [archaeon]